jgi:hypothetical protein
MSTVLSDLRAELDVDLTGAAQQLADARLRREQLDSAVHRRAVADWLDRINGLLDMRLDAEGPRRSTGRAVS